MMNKLLWISLIVTAVLVDQGKGSVPLPVKKLFSKGLHGGQIIEMHGDLRPTSYRTVVNIQRDLCLDPEDDYNIAMHMAMYEHKFVFNHKDGGSFGREESADYNDSVKFQLKIVPYIDSTIVYSGENLVHQFKHRIDMKANSYYLCIYGPSPLDLLKWDDLLHESERPDKS